MVTREKTKAIIKLLVRVVITIILLLVLVSQIDLRQVYEALKKARLEYLVVVWIFSILSLLILSLKLHFILKKQQCPVPIRTIFRISAITALYSMVMPGMLSTGVKWYILKQHTGKGSNVLSSMIYNQVTDIYFRILLGLFAIAFAFPAQYKKVPLICGIAAIFLIIIYILLFNKHTGVKINALMRYLLKPLPKIIYNPAKTILQQLQVFQSAGLKFHLIVVAISVVVSLISVFVYIYAAKAALIKIPVSGLIWQSSAIYILGRLPISIANCGVREWSLIGCMSIYNVDKSQTILMSVIIFTGAIIRAIIGAIYLLFKKTGNNKSLDTAKNISEQDI